MKFEIEFHDSVVKLIKKTDAQIEVHLDAVLIVTDPRQGWLEDEDHRVPAIIRLNEASANLLPTVGTLFDGNVTGVIGQSFKGVVPIGLKYSGEVELWLSGEAGESQIKGSGIEVIVERASLPKHLVR